MSDTTGREATRTRITVEQEPKTIADITVYPDEVIVALDIGRDGSLTAAQAFDLGNALIAASAEAKTIEWVDEHGENLDVRSKA